VCIFVLDVCENIYVCVMMRTRGADERERERDGGRRERWREEREHWAITTTT